MRTRAKLEEGIAALAAEVRELQIAPAAEPARAAVVSVLQAVGGEDSPAFRRESHALKEALASLREARAVLGVSVDTIQPWQTFARATWVEGESRADACP